MANLSGCRVLIVEDELLLAMDLETICTGAGCKIAGPFSNVPDGLKEVRERRPDAAIVDLNVNGQWTFPLADALDDANIPFVILTGHSRDMIPERHARRPHLFKPYQPSDLLQILHTILDGGEACEQKLSRSA